MFRCGACTVNQDTGIKTCTYSNVTYKLYYPRCKKQNVLCSATRGAYVPAITVCRQQLY